MIRRHSRPHESPGCRQPLEHVDLGDDIRGLEELIGRIEAGRPRSHDGYTNIHPLRLGLRRAAVAAHSSTMIGACSGQLATASFAASIWSSGTLRTTPL